MILNTCEHILWEYSAQRYSRNLKKFIFILFWIVDAFSRMGNTKSTPFKKGICAHESKQKITKSVSLVKNGGQSTKCVHSPEAIDTEPIINLLLSQLLNDLKSFLSVRRASKAYISLCYMYLAV